MKVKLAVCTRCHPLARSKDDQVPKVPTLALPNGLRVCHKCYSDIAMARVVQENK